MNLAMSINIEAAELLEIFQWSDKKDADNKIFCTDCSIIEIALPTLKKIRFFHTHY